jgi:methylphosphotriester-DNA--protein-cysteine methyltransferase
MCEGGETMKKIIAYALAVVFALVACSAGISEGAELVASKNSDKYHLAVCATAQKIDAANKITFNTPEDAVKAGYSPCKLCNPPTKTAIFVASRNSDKYHVASCKMAQNISAENKVAFASAEDAKKAGYTPCKACCK